MKLERQFVYLWISVEYRIGFLLLLLKKLTDNSSVIVNILR